MTTAGSIGFARVHLWPFGAPITDTSRCTECGITWAEHYSAPDCKLPPRLATPA